MNLECKRSNSDRGAVLALLVIAIPVFILLMAIAIDLTLAAAAQQQARSLARLLALKAVEQFGSPENPNADLQSRLERVQSSATELLTQSDLLGYHLDPNSVRVVGLSDTSPKEFVLIPGSYFAADLAPSECINNNCNPCQNGENPPCFVPLNPAAGQANPESRVNGFRVDIRGERSIATFFAGALFSGAGVKPNASATAIVVPRNTMFVVDISRSMIRGTHRRRPVQSQIDHPENGRGAQLAFEATPDIIECAHGGGGCPDNLSYDPVQIGDYAQWRFLNRYNGGLSRPGGNEPAAVHYYDDYVRVQVQNSLAEADASPSDDCPTVDVKPAFHPAVGANDQYLSSIQDYYLDNYSYESGNGPMPLGIVMNGVLDQVTNLQSRQYSADQVGAVFFERKASWNRIIKPSGDYTYLANVAGNRCYQYRLGIFPTTEKFTDLRLALLEAVNQLNSVRISQSLPSQDSIVLVTDGMTNCTQYEATQQDQTRFDFNADGRIDTTDLVRFLACFGRLPRGDGPGQDPTTPAYCPVPPLTTQDFVRFIGMLGRIFGCVNDYAHYVASMQDVKLQVQALAGRAVKIHVLAVGEHIGPNIRLVKDDQSDPNSNVCLTEEQARSRNIATVEGGWSGSSSNEAFVNASVSAPFKQAGADLYDLARLTGGVFQPLFPEPVPGCAPRLTPYQCTQASETLMTDPSCRTQVTQIRDFINSAVNDQSPFIVVDSQ